MHSAEVVSHILECFQLFTGASVESVRCKELTVVFDTVSSQKKRVSSLQLFLTIEVRWPASRFNVGFQIGSQYANLP